MIKALHAQSPAVPLASFLGAAIRKFNSASRDKALETLTCAHLERIASSAPHLLADAGFRLDTSVSIADTEVWQNDTHTVILTAHAPHVHVSRR